MSRQSKQLNQQLAALYDYKSTTDTENILEIRSDTLDPLTSNATKYVFRLEPTGFLDENSLLTFKLKSTVAQDQHCRVNCWNGALGAIQRCELTVGDFVLNDSDGVADWATLETFGTVNRAQQNSVLSHYLGNQFYTQSVATPSLNAANVPVITTGEIYPDPDKCGIALGGYEDGTVEEGGAYSARGDITVARINSHRLSYDTDNNPTYAVPLGMIIPALKGRTVPLFMFSEYRIYITVYFNTSDKYVNNITDAAYAGTGKLAAGASDVSVQNVKLQIDYLIYPSAVQDKLMSQLQTAQGYTMDFFDVVHIMKQLPAGANNTEQIAEFRIGQNDREVHSVYMMRKLNNRGGRQCSMLLEQRVDGMPIEAIQWNINGADEYPEFKENFGSHYDAVADALGTDLDVERPMFFCDVNTEWSQLASAYNPLLGTYKPLAIDLRNGNPGILGAGRRIGNYPIICKYKRRPHGAVALAAGNPAFNDTTGAMNIDFYAKCSRRAVITAGAKGNNVVVSY